LQVTNKFAKIHKISCKTFNDRFGEKKFCIVRNSWIFKYFTYCAVNIKISAKGELPKRAILSKLCGKEISTCLTLPLRP
jgi:hypothetical protein